MTIRRKTLALCRVVTLSVAFDLLEIVGHLFVRSVFFILSVVFNDSVAAQRTLLGSIAVYRFGSVPWTV